MLQSTRLLALIVVVLSLSLFGSHAIAGGFGLKVGASIPRWTMAAENKQYQNLNNLSDFSICGIVNFPLSHYISIQVEPAYSRQEFTLDYQKAALEELAKTAFPTALPNSLSFTQDFVNISCPVLLKVSPLASGIRPYFLGGVVASINISATSTANFDTTNMNLVKPIDVKPTAKAVAYGLQLGAGIEIPLIASISFVADARYSFPLSDAASLSAFGTSLGSVKAANVLILAGVNFDW